ncbi:MAG: Lrp/AsnC family transcriptional regulator [Roseitalea sp.]|jgi:Lrp/AsnC family leucine-responsive transcriptional regulator|uniref:Lrp/AsnC family transcriptional regulator n=1 Tax=Oceaniradius stylonematis TaxID=2184161 RepID=UPI000D6B1B2D|nr:Lrp/AsnC family transcriptional regulator [Oceaniradius stylonematis]MBO6553800.1 Lrp/AsnC family transcriptional regulator [Roseitalea sp.]MBO6953076.1 Lrp/AsnC family transcriptional regulator [Rhizobiaceae bacterium]MBO6593423.1 Lrp/AsnC family transcriptional regulator [Roseitalea sp.]MBO6600587.1 Lrp/AsnC family transcriptional regulator [Roseitalea sp.]MBO6612268.1 Lrp/AsnC family transcriptional regulator [Roseitalea sp.]
MISLDPFEVAMLDVLQRDGRRTITDLAADVGLSATPCARRFDRLTESGAIRAIVARLDRRALGLEVEVFVQVRLGSHADDTPERFIAMVGRLDEVVACWSLTGDFDFMLQVVVTDVEALNDFIGGTLLKFDGVRDVRTNLVLKNHKGPAKLPLGHLT